MNGLRQYNYRENTQHNLTHILILSDIIEVHIRIVNVNTFLL